MNVAWPIFASLFQCGNYGIGGHYFIHPDYHNYRHTDYHPYNTGNRLATILTVLQAPEAGKKEYFSL